VEERGSVLRSVDELSNGRGAMETYLILRRAAWQDANEADEARVRAAAQAERLSEFVGWLRTYTFAERDGTIGSVCVYEAAGPEAIRRHSAAALLPVDEIVQVDDVIVARPEYGPAWT
jgi:Protein of unknown function (DUF4242)